MMGTVVLNPADFEVLMGEYQQPDGRVCYKRFIDDMDRVFTQSDIDKDPLFQVKQIDRTTTLPARRRYQDLQPEELEALNAVLGHFRKEIQNRRVFMKPQFQDFDQTMNGYISKNQFSRILYQFNLFPAQQHLDLILLKYMDNGNQDEVNYYQFCKDVDVFDEGVDISQKHLESFATYQAPEMRATFIHNDRPDDLEDVITKLRARVKEFRIRVREFLRDFDELRLGKITRSQFRSGMNIASMPLSDHEFNLLVEEFKIDANMFDWRRFCDRVEEVF